MGIGFEGEMIRGVRLHAIRLLVRCGTMPFVAAACTGLALAATLVGCVNPQRNTGPAVSKSNSLSSLGNVIGSSSGNLTTNETQCLIFKNNSRDYSTCLGCKQTLCPCTELIGSTCVSTDIGACSLGLSALVQCVHNNVSAAGGTCIGLKCGDGQSADFTSCSCKDSTPPSSIGPAPGYEDSLTPILQPGFSVNSRTCFPADISTNYNDGSFTPNINCLVTSGGKGYPSDENPGTPPRNNPIVPVNLFQDVGYLRWDLSLDASQFSPAAPLVNHLPFLGTWSTFPATLSLFFQLKPNTTLSLNSSTVNWTDCVEHFSGYQKDTTPSYYVTSHSACEERASPSTSAPASKSIAFQFTGGNTNTGTAIESMLGFNGTPANSNLSSFATALQNSGSPNIKITSAATTPANVNYGLGKRDNGNTTGSGSTSASNPGVGLASNIGYYKYTWGPVAVRRPPPAATTDIASGTVSSRIALNVNMGFTPAGVVESTAMSPDAITNSVESRDCSTTAIPNPCIVTGVYRSSGGAILTQSFSPRFQNNHHASPVGLLPAGITAVSTPKLIEDTSQLDLSSAGARRPARLRAFVRASDGNIYMSRYESSKWNSWMSLGRPWTCASSDTKCTALKISPLVYAPYVPTTAGLAIGNPGFNDGISIVGEPMVATYMDPCHLTSTTCSTTTSIIAIFARVSQYLSSTGTFGPYHNSVFYTFAVVENSLASLGSTLTFDKATTWSQWMPVVAGTTANDIWQSQGNPVVFIRKNSGANPYRLYIVATSARTNIASSATAMFHPPIAPISTTTLFQSTPNNITGSSLNWFSYGHRVIWTNLDISTFASTSWTAYTEPPLTWQAITGSTSTRYAIASDWTASPVDPSALTTAGNTVADHTRIRLTAAQLVQESTTNGAITITAPTNPTAGTFFSPRFYSRTTNYIELDIAGAAPYNLSDPNVGGTISSGLPFIGTPHGINLGDISSADQAAPNSGANHRHLVFGRTLCTPGKNCDTVNPTAGYVTINSLDGPISDTGYFNTYDSSGATQSNLIQAFYPTADIIPIQSHALLQSGYDVPIYLFTRDSNGFFTVGFFDSINGAGGQQFKFFTIGGFLN